MMRPRYFPFLSPFPLTPSPPLSSLSSYFSHAWLAVGSVEQVMKERVLRLTETHFKTASTTFPLVIDIAVLSPDWTASKH